MAALKATDDQIVSAYREAEGDVCRAADMVGLSVRVFHSRIADYERRNGITLRGKSRVVISRDTRPNPIDLTDGVIFVASDAHYWPGDASAAHRGLVKLTKKLGPDIVVMNGDEFDGAAISRHGRIGWEHRPTVSEELKVLSERLREIHRAAPRAHRLGTFGNHTNRLDSYIASNAVALEGVKGIKFEDMYPDWNYAWAWLVNGHTLIKHRIKNGIHATWTATGDAQISTVTGHLHNLRVTPRSTMSPINGGLIYGVDTGMLADPWGPQFQYMEQGPRNWRSGFAVLTFADGRLMPPELVSVIEEDAVFFRGNRIEV